MAPDPDDPRQPGVFVLLPVLDEVHNIGPLLDEIGQALAGQPHTIAALDDGSTDGTLASLERRMSDAGGGQLHLIRRTKRGRGSQRGGALQALLLWGLENTRHQVFVEMDGDRSHRPDELAEGIRLVAAVRMLISRRIRDYSNGYRFYNRAAARLAATHQLRYTSSIYLAEVLALWQRNGLTLREFPTTYLGRSQGLSRLRGVDLAKATLGLFGIALRYHLAGFRPRSSPGPVPGSRASSAPQPD